MIALSVRKPRLEWQSDDRASTTMGSVPSLMILHSKARGTISRMDDWLASRVADAGMCLLLLAGSAGWWLNYRSDVPSLARGNFITSLIRPPRLSTPPSKGSKSTA
jgi:hypothetical protein